MGEAGLPFRRHPDVGPSGKVTIMGPSRCNAERMAAYASRRNSSVPDLAHAYLRFGAEYGVRGDVAYCQALYDTRAWTTEPAGSPWKPLALSSGRSVSDEASVEQHIQLLHAFAANKSAGYEESAEVAERRSRMERAGWLGTVRHWEDLNGKWQLPGSKYGQDIVAIWRGMMEWSGKGEVHVDIETQQTPEDRSLGDTKTGSIMSRVSRFRAARTCYG
ncbi:hypothetical protein [Cohnella faecalis]|uniref:Uncharacterized protein n=1 Tax=Cohnella faecalis TaxID=2315694 RepID=A0A398CMY2_9BACL|nr:hypothetical protein [Cohnella faecalis]RIE01267.1 hypothetical protein D3H35_23040 [Cohnella faecalis]